MLVMGIPVDIDVYDYLTSRGIRKVHKVGTYQMGCCPFHPDDTPSFGVDVNTGYYNCFGCKAKGTFQELVARLDKFDTSYDAAKHLITVYGKYSTFLTDDPLVLQFGDDVDLVSDNYSISEEVLERYKFRHPYLTKRGISEKWQRLFEVGYNKASSTITLPYRDHLGRLVTVKHRSVLSKAFYYDPPMPKRVKAGLIYGLDKVLKWGIKQVAIVEGEIDAISVWQTETVGAVAIGGNQFNDELVARLVQTLSDNTELIIFTDNDAGGEYAKSSILDKLSGRFELSQVDWSMFSGCKDANDVGVDGIKVMLEHRERKLGLKI